MAMSDSNKHQQQRDDDRTQEMLDRGRDRSRRQRKVNAAIGSGKTPRAIRAIGGSELALDYERLLGASPIGPSEPAPVAPLDRPAATHAAAQAVVDCAYALRIAVQTNAVLPVQTRLQWPDQITPLLGTQSDPWVGLPHVERWIADIEAFSATVRPQPFDPWNVSLAALSASLDPLDDVRQPLLRLRAALLHQARVGLGQ
jgi:hypothetical protein